MTLLASVRRHSIRVQHHLHRWSICGTDGGQLLSDGFSRPDIGMSRSSSCSSTSSDSALSSESVTPASVGPFTVVLLGDNGVGKSALASIFAGASDSMGSECELYGGMWTINWTFAFRFLFKLLTDTSTVSGNHLAFQWRSSFSLWFEYKPVYGCYILA